MTTVGLKPVAAVPAGMRGRWLPVVCMLLLAGCAGTAPDRAPDSDGDGLTDVEEREVHGTDPQAADTDGDGVDDGTAVREAQRKGGQRDHHREQSEVSSGLDPLKGGFYAEQTVTLWNDVDAPLLMHAATVNGDVLVEVVEEDRYRVIVHLRASGNSEQDARDHLATMKVKHTDVYRQARIEAATTVVFEEYQVPPLVPGVTVGQSRSADITVQIPAHLAGLALDTTNGRVDIPALEASAVTADSTNGDIVLHGVRAARIAVDTTNGDLRLTELQVEELRGDTTNGDVNASVTPTGSGTWSLDSTNGDIDLRVAVQDRFGYDIMADTTNGRAVIEVRDTEPVGEQEEDEAHHRTSGFSSRPIKVDVRLDSTNGDVHARG